MANTHSHTLTRVMCEMHTDDTHTSDAPQVLHTHTWLSSRLPGTVALCVMCDAMSNRNRKHEERGSLRVFQGSTEESVSERELRKMIE